MINNDCKHADSNANAKVQLDIQTIGIVESKLGLSGHIPEDKNLNQQRRESADTICRGKHNLSRLHRYLNKFLTINFTKFNIIMN